MCTSVQAVPLKIRRWIFYFQPVPRGTGGAPSPTTPQSTQPRVDQPKSILCRAKPLNTKLRCENKQRAASLRQSGSRAIFRWPPVGRSASWKLKKKLRLWLFGVTIKTTRSRQNIKWSWTSAILSCHETHRSAHAYMSMYESLCLRISILAARARPTCTRSRPDRVWSLQIRSDHRPHTVGPGGVPLSCS